MKKQAFQLVSLGSSNTAVTCGCTREMMKRATLLLFTLMVASMLVGSVAASPTVGVQPPIIQPGDSVTITGQSIADALVSVSIENTRGILTSFNITADTLGTYSTEYTAPEDAPVDVYTITVKSNNETASTSFIVSRMDQAQLVNTIRVMVVNAKYQAESATIQARKQGHSVPSEVIDKYREGLQSLADAVEAIDDQNYAEAQQSLREAMNRFNEVIEYSYGDYIQPSVNPVEAENRVQERTNLLWRQYNQINTTLQILQAYGIDVDSLVGEMNTLRNRITEAEQLMEEGKLAEAETSITETQRLLAQRLVALQTRQGEVTKRLAERYQTSLENRVRAYIDTFKQLQTVRPVQSGLALEELARLENRLNESSTLLEEGNVITALREMQSTENRIKRLSESVNGAVTKRYLDRIDELTAGLQTSNNPEVQDEINDIKEALRDYLHSKKPSTGSQQSR